MNGFNKYSMGEIKSHLQWEQDPDLQVQQEEEQVRPVGLARVAESYKHERLFEFARW
jgi:hypothetical protein